VPAPRVRLFTNDLEAEFVSRPNRFVVEARAGDRLVKAHCPNPGRMLELLVPGRRLILQRRAAPPPSPAPGRLVADSAGGRRRGPRLEYTLAAAYYQGTVIPLQSALANPIAERLLLPVACPDLERFEREVTVGGSRLDFRLFDRRDPRPMYLEVKSCTLVEEGTAMFPDAQTARGLKHLEELDALAAAGSRAGVLFVVQSPHARRFVPDVHTDLSFSRRLIELRDRIWIRAASIRTTPDGAATLEQTAIPLDVAAAARCAEDRGSYLLVARCPKSLRLSVGALGEIDFPGGYYVYVGSAMAGLDARLARHRRKSKTLRWHIDFLLDRVPAQDIHALPIRTPHRLECSLAREIASLAADRIVRFGSSDCACPSHLFYFPTNPLHSERFLRVLLRFRHDVALRP
jgi:sugar fermentation stimulation protein A